MRRAPPSGEPLETGAPPVRRWSTDAVGARDRLDYWVGAICECFLEMDASAPAPRAFGCELVSAELGRLRVNRVAGSAQDVYRTRAAIARSRDAWFYLLRKAATPCAVVQHGAAADRLLPGDLALIDSRLGYELHFPDTVDIVSVQLPIDWLETWLPEPRRHLGRRIDGATGWGGALGAYLGQLAASPAAAAAPPPGLLADHLGSLLALALAEDGGAAATPRRADPVDRIDAAIAERCTDPDLAAGALAEAVGVSVRTLHRVLATRGQPFAARLMAHRIERARRMLQSPQFDRLTTAEIGRRVGLLDPSHFVRVCRRHAGCTPQALRARR